MMAKEIKKDNKKNIREKQKKSTPKIKREGRGRFAKGVSANPAGRPKKGDATADILNNIFKEDINEKNYFPNSVAEIIGKHKISKKEALLRYVVALAFEGNMTAVNLVIDRVDGKALERVVNFDPDAEFILR